jgi:hypothetical protein
MFLLQAWCSSFFKKDGVALKHGYCNNGHVPECILYTWTHGGTGDATTMVMSPNGYCNNGQFFVFKLIEN